MNPEQQARDTQIQTFLAQHGITFGATGTGDRQTPIDIHMTDAELRALPFIKDHNAGHAIQFNGISSHAIKTSDGKVYNIYRGIRGDMELMPGNFWFNLAKITNEPVK